MAPSSAAATAEHAGDTDGLVLDEAAETLTKVVSMGRKFISDRIERAVALSEQGVLDVGSCVSRLVEDARSQVAESEDVLGSVEGESGISHAIGSQSRAMANFIAELQSLLDEQREIARIAVEQSAQILDAAAQIANIARKSRIININASIEAARLEEQGAAFEVISSEMTSFSHDVEKANSIIGQLARSLSEFMPTLATRTEQLVNSSEAFANKFEDDLQRVNSAEEGLRDSVRQAIASSEQRASRMLNLSQEALSHLQFQDPMAQSLRQIHLLFSKIIDHTASVATAAGAPEDTVETLRSEAPDGGGSVGLSDIDTSAGRGSAIVDLDRNPMEAALAARLEEDAESGGVQEDIDAPESGDVLLF